MSKKIITISREFGSGGRVIGKRLAEELGFDFYDKEVIAKVAEKTGFAKEFIEKRGEYSAYKNIFSYAFAGRTSTGMSVDDMIIIEQNKLINEIADKGNCVIVGRCADYFLRERKDALHVFIYGNMPEKIKRITELYSHDEDAAKVLIKDMDKKRAVNHQYTTGKKWGARDNYDISINSSTFGYDKCIEILKLLAES